MVYYGLAKAHHMRCLNNTLSKHAIDAFMSSTPEPLIAVANYAL